MGITAHEREMAYRIECYEDSATRPHQTEYAETERAARRIAARMLGHVTLRGAASWDRYQGGTVYQFGPRREDNGYDFVVVVDQTIEAREDAEWRLADGK